MIHAQDLEYYDDSSSRSLSGDPEYDEPPMEAIGAIVVDEQNECQLVVAPLSEYQSGDQERTRRLWV